MCTVCKFEIAYGCFWGPGTSAALPGFNIQLGSTRTPYPGQVCSNLFETAIWISWTGIASTGDHLHPWTEAEYRSQQIPCGARTYTKTGPHRMCWSNAPDSFSEAHDRIYIYSGVSIFALWHSYACDHRLRKSRSIWPSWTEEGEYAALVSSWIGI